MSTRGRYRRTNTASTDRNASNIRKSYNKVSTESEKDNDIEDKPIPAVITSKFVVDDLCYSDSKPCKHDVYVNGVKGLLTGDVIYRYLLKKNMDIPEHFLIYKANIL